MNIINGISNFQSLKVMTNAENVFGSRALVISSFKKKIKNHILEF
jgi:hypothetical protein